MDPFLPDDRKLDAIRELLPSLGSGIRLDTTLAGPFPAETGRAIHQLAEHELQVGRGGADRADEASQRADEAGSVVAAVLGTSTERVLLTPGPIAALSAALTTIGRRRRGAVVIVGELRPELDAAIATLARASGMGLVRTATGVPAGATLVVAAHVDPATGQVLETKPLVERAHAVGATIVLDASWSAGAIPVDAVSTGVDLLLADAHLWLLGPAGVTALWVADRDLAARMRRLVDPLPPWLLLGVARSVGWLLMYVSLPWAFERAERLTARLRDALAAIEGVELLAPAAGIATTLPFRVPGWSAAEVAHELGRRAHAHMGLDERSETLLASIGAWIREDEVERCTEALAEIAAHTPATLPRRPLLTVLAPAAWDER